MKADSSDVSHACPSPGEEGQKNCWLQFLASGNKVECLFPSDKKLGNCLDCNVFLEFTSRFVGRRIADRIAEESLKSLIKQITIYDSQLDKIYIDLKKRVEELSLLKKVSDALPQSKDLDKTLRIILTGVTAGEVFGFNRAFIFLVNQKTQSLEGRVGLGPKDEEEALRIWSKIKQDKITFEQMLENVLLSEEEENELTVRVKGLSFSLQEKENILVKAVLERRSYNLKSEELSGLNPRQALGLFSSTGFMLIPILSENIPLGLLAVDNLITKNEIMEEDRIGLETFANQAAYQIDNILLLQEIKQRQKELELATKLLRENQSYLLQTERWVDIGKIATTVAHEIKTPLVAIGGYARRALKKSEQGKLSSHELEVIIKETERLESITAEILDYSKPTKLNYEKIDLNQLIRSALEVLKDKLKYNGIKLRTRLLLEAPIVDIDPKRIEQVLFNLMENSIEAMPQGGFLTVKTKRKEDFALFEIEDNGCGIDEENIQKLYIPFFTTKPKGSGLGLPVSKKIIADHSGYIEVKSELNKGTKFTVYLPM